MTFMKGAVFLLLLATVSINADHDNHNNNDCDAWNKTITVKDLQKVLGEWILIWAVSDQQDGREHLRNLSSSHVEITHLPDQNILSFVEENNMIDNSCNKWVINITIPTEPEAFTLHVSSAEIQKDGVPHPYNETMDVEFYQTGDNIVIVWKEAKGKYVIISKKEDHHMDAAKLKEDQESYLKLAECMKIPHDVIFTYNGAAEFCHKKPAPEAVPPEVDAPEVLDPEASS